MDMVRAIRNLRASMNVQAGHKARLMVRPAAGWEQTISGAEGYFKRLANVSAMELLSGDAAITEKTVSAVCTAGEFFIPLGDLVDIDKEIARLEKEFKNLQGEIARANGKLNNQGFLSKAPAALVEQEKEKLRVNETKLQALEARIAGLKANN